MGSAQQALPQAGLVSGALPRRDVRRSPPRRAPLARERGGRVRFSVRRGPGLRADAACLGADTKNRARSADSVPLAQAARKRGAVHGCEAPGFSVAGRGGERASRTVLGRGGGTASPDAATPRRDAPESSSVLAVYRCSDPDEGRA